MTVKQAAERLEVSPSTVYALVGAGRLKCHRVGLGRGAIRISEGHVVAYLEAGEPAPKPTPQPARRVTLRHL